MNVPSLVTCISNCEGSCSEGPESVLKRMWVNRERRGQRGCLAGQKQWVKPEGTMFPLKLQKGRKLKTQNVPGLE